MSQGYTLTFLGTGTSTGVPQIGCRCQTCTSADPRDKRLRASAIVTTPKGNNFLIDCGPDFRAQMLAQGSPRLDAALLTHTHYDHVGGIDDMRPYCAQGPFPVYCEPNVADDLRHRVPYCFAEHLYPGVPTFTLHNIDRNKPFTVRGEEVVPLPVMHAKLPIVGFRFGPLAYITDCKTMPEETYALLRDLDVLVINALRHEPHMRHISLSEALQIIDRVKPRRAYLTHMAHQMGPHAQCSQLLPPNVFFAYDGLTVQAADACVSPCR